MNGVTAHERVHFLECPLYCRLSIFLVLKPFEGGVAPLALLYETGAPYKLTGCNFQ